MDFEQELKQVAATYASKGYQVTTRPQPGDLPPFAKDFKVEIVGKRGPEGVLVTVKKNRDEVAADANMPRYAEIIGAQPMWRFDFFVLEGEGPMGRDMRGAREFSNEEIDKSLTEAEQMVRMGFIRPGVIAAWAGMEAAMRMRLRAAGEKAGWGTMPRAMMTELYSSGVLSADEFEQLVNLSQLRNEIVHGFASPISDAEEVQFLTSIARRLLRESQIMKQSA